MLERSFTLWVVVAVFIVFSSGCFVLRWETCHAWGGQIPGGSMVRHACFKSNPAMALTRSVRRVSGQMERGGETKRIISPAEEDVNELGPGLGPSPHMLESLL